MFALAVLIVALGAPPGSVAVRKAPPLTATEVEAAVRSAPMKLPKGAALTGVHVTALPPVSAVFSKVSVEVTPPVQKTGAVSAVAIATFLRDDEIVARVPLRLDLRITKEAQVWDVGKGTAVKLVVQRGLVEISAPAVTSEAADIGDLVQVLLRPSGRALRARLVTHDRAVLVEEGTGS